MFLYDCKFLLLLEIKIIEDKKKQKALFFFENVKKDLDRIEAQLEEISKSLNRLTHTLTIFYSM